MITNQIYTDQSGFRNQHDFFLENNKTGLMWKKYTSFDKIYFLKFPSCISKLFFRYKFQGQNIKKKEEKLM